MFERLAEDAVRRDILLTLAGTQGCYSVGAVVSAVSEASIVAEDRCRETSRHPLAHIEEQGGSRERILDHNAV